ncbi:MAG: CRTAC1 family protein [Verrucomicrobia bacterium]|nr:CRTAC1 family protein [Verrucomicrobiota bacterium]
MGAALLMLLSISCDSGVTKTASEETNENPALASHQRMVRALAKIAEEDARLNPYYSDLRVRRLTAALAGFPSAATAMEKAPILASLGLAQMDYGQLDESIANLRKAYDAFASSPDPGRTLGEVAFALGVANLRLAETENCCANHTPDSCILPIQGDAIHKVRRGSEAAIKYFAEAIENESMPERSRQKSTWLLNLAYMTLGEYPAKVPPLYRLPENVFQSGIAVPKMPNVAGKLGLDTDSMSGGVAIDDFDGDLLLDVVVSSWDASFPMKYFENRGKDGFAERSRDAGFEGMLGGFNLITADYDNDGDVDIYVTRGAWLGELGKRPNSLLQNQGDGTFLDVTYMVGLGEDHYPSQTAAWADYDNDGDLDLFVGNEHKDGELELDGGIEGTEEVIAPCQLFRNNGDGTFTDVAEEAGVTNLRFTKGSTWADIDGDRFPDLILSNLSGENRLFHNQQDGSFFDIVAQAGIQEPYVSFPVWTWDFDNDGVVDIFISSFRGSTDSYMMHALGQKYPMPSGHYRGNGDGTFTNVAEEQKLDAPMLTMGANFGDINNDGYLDFYVGTGQPDISILVPNMLFVNQHGKRFHDVTMASGLGHLQKGHAIAFADLDQDGDQDIFAQMGGARRVDSFRDALYANRGGTPNRWITVRLVGVTSNRSAIGARLKVTITEKGEQRAIYRWVNTGASFGANPLRQHIGIGTASAVDSLEVYWPTSDTTQEFKNLPVGKMIEIHEDSDAVKTIDLESFPFVPNL